MFSGVSQIRLHDCGRDEQDLLYDALLPEKCSATGLPCRKLVKRLRCILQWIQGIRSDEKAFYCSEHRLENPVALANGVGSPSAVQTLKKAWVLGLPLYEFTESVR